MDSLVLYEDRMRRASDLPSWVPDWRIKDHRAFRMRHSAHADIRRLSGLAPLQDPDDYGQLKLAGVIVGHIRELKQLKIQFLEQEEPKLVAIMGNNYRLAWNNDTMALAEIDYRLDIAHILGQVVWRPYFSSPRLIASKAANLDDWVVAFRGSPFFFILQEIPSGGDRRRFHFLGPVEVLFEGMLRRYEFRSKIDPFMEEMILV